MKIVELNEGEIPCKECHIYPDLGLKLFKVRHLFSSRFEYNVTADFFVKINRDGFEYLIKVKDIYRSDVEDLFYKNINDFITRLNLTAIQIIEKYIINENISSGLNNGTDITIYKYKSNKLYAEV